MIYHIRWTMYDVIHAPMHKCVISHVRSCTDTFMHTSAGRGEIQCRLCRGEKLNLNYIIVAFSTNSYNSFEQKCTLFSFSHCNIAINRGVTQTEYVSVWNMSLWRTLPAPRLFFWPFPLILKYTNCCMDKWSKGKGYSPFSVHHLFAGGGRLL